MPIQFSQVTHAQKRGGGAFSVKAIDLQKLGERASPVLVLDDFRVRGRPFAPHPHAGFSAVTYVFEDSPGSLRSRDSLGNDMVTAPGGIVWTQAGSGLIHEEVPSELDRELHGLQIFVNLSSQNKIAPPKMFRLQNNEVPEWRNAAGDRVRVVAGAFEGAVSPLVTAEPFILLDVRLLREISFNLPGDHNAIVYVLAGDVMLRAEARHQTLSGDQALAVYGGSGRVTFEASQAAHLVILSGLEIREPVLIEGSFIMNNRSQIEAAVARYRAGEMGRL
jgi:redox-sensitive bicupin YhaK (pirin superfamily)